MLASALYRNLEQMGLRQSFYYPVNDVNVTSRGLAESLGGQGRTLYHSEAVAAISAIWLIIHPIGWYNSHPEMDVSRPHTAICPTLDSSVLSVLAGTSRPLTGREIARLLRRKSHGGVLEVLNRLADHGLVDRQEAGRALLYTLNRDHLAAPAVDVLAGMRSELLNRLRGLIERWDLKPIHVSLFGSAARGEGNTESDIDLFVVRPDAVSADDPRWRGQLDQLADSVGRWTGNHAGIAEVAKSDVQQLRRENPPIAKELRSDAIAISGPEVRKLLGSGR